MEAGRYMTVHRLVWKLTELMKDDGLRFGVLKNVKLLVVDECQDVNWSQCGWLTEFINRFNVHVMCVGDVNQAIFGSMNYFQTEDNLSSLYHKLMDDVRRTDKAHLTLTTNHRSTQRIQHMATSVLVQQQKSRTVTAIKTKVVGIEPVLWSEFSDSFAQATFIAKKVLQLTKSATGGNGIVVNDHNNNNNNNSNLGQSYTHDAPASLKFDDIAVLVRYNRHKVALQQAFKRFGIPVKMLGAPAWLKNAEVKVLLGMLHLSVDWRPFIFRFVYEHLRLFRPMLASSASSSSVRVDDFIYGHNCDSNDLDGILPDLLNEQDPFIALIGRTIVDVRGLQNDSTVTTAVTVTAQLQAVATSLKIQKSASPELQLLFEYADSLQCLRQLLDTSSNWQQNRTEPTPIQYDPDRSEMPKEDDHHHHHQNVPECVTISTFHCAKGNEWEAVFICNLNDHHVARSKLENESNRGDIIYDEECRLIYTAFTRAKQFLFCSYVAEDKNPLLSIVEPRYFQQLEHNEPINFGDIRTPVATMVGQNSICYLQFRTDMNEPVLSRCKVAPFYRKSILISKSLHVWKKIRENLPNHDDSHVTGIDSLSMTPRNITIRVVHPQLMQRFSNVQLTIFSDSMIETLLPDSFARCDQLTDMTFNRNEITFIPPRAFQMCTKLRSLDFTTNHILWISDESFAGLHNLETLTLTDNRLNYVTPNAFHDLVSLRSLSLSNNFMPTIDADSFNGLQNLENLFLNNMQLTNMVPGMFQSLQNLRILQINDASMSNIPPNIFSPLKSLSFLQLLRNGITRLNSHSFGYLPNLEHFFISHRLSTQSLNAIERNFFANFPRLIEFGSATGCSCDGRVRGIVNMTSIDFSGETVFDSCFYYWEGISTTTESNTTPDVNAATDISTKFTFSMIIIVTVKVLVF